MGSREIIVGTDGSRGSDRAVRWAAREARLSGDPLRILTTVDWNWTSGRFTGGVTERQLAQDATETVLASARLIAHRLAPGVRVHCAAEAGSAAAALLRAGHGAALLVVGSRGRGGFAGLLLGSVGYQVATHARCPVAVVRGQRDERAGPVVVGLDGGPSSQNTLATAFGLASVRSAPLSAVRACREPSALYGKAFRDAACLEGDEQRMLEQEIAPWREKFPTVTVETRVSRGDARAVLVDVSRTAQLLVVGGRSGSTSPGSVTLRTLHHAGCPVVVAREPGS